MSSVDDIRRSDSYKALARESREAFSRIAGAEIHWNVADEHEKAAREELHQLRLRFERLARALRVLEGNQ